MEIFIKDKIKLHLLTPITMFLASNFLCSIIEKIFIMPSLYSESIYIMIAIRNLLEFVIVIATLIFTMKFGLIGLQEAKESEFDYTYKLYIIVCYIGMVLDIIWTIMFVFYIFN